MASVLTAPKKNLADCPQCSGSGISTSGRCSRCAGSGKLVIRETAEGWKETSLLLD
jgi:DnaJ-class molecular chaperone